MKRFVLGSWSISGDYGYKNTLKTLNLFKFAYQENINEYDTAPNYGNGYAEFLLGKFFKGKKKALLNTKVGNDHNRIKSFKIKDIEKSFFKSLKNLKKINTLFLHNPRDDIEYSVVIPFLNDLKKNKLISDFGISLAKDYKYKKNELKYFSIFQTDYNLLNFKTLIDFKRYNIFARSPLASGLLAKDINTFTLSKKDHRKSWLSTKRLRNINLKKKMIEQNIKGDLKENAIQFLKKNKSINKIIFGAKNEYQLKNLITIYKQNSLTNFGDIKKKLYAYDKKFKEVGY